MEWAVRLLTLVQTSCLAASFGALLCACGSPPALDAEVAELCRAHAGDALVFQWPEGREVLPVDSGVTPEEDRALRARFALPAQPPSSMLSHPISAVEPFGDGWLIGTDFGEWGGALFFVRQGEAAQEVQRGNVRALIGSKSGVYAFFGLAHRGFDEGDYRFISASNAWIEVSEPAELPGSPLAIARKGDALFMAGGPQGGGRWGWARVFHPGQKIQAATVLQCR